MKRMFIQGHANLFGIGGLLVALASFGQATISTETPFYIWILVAAGSITSIFGYLVAFSRSSYILALRLLYGDDDILILPCRDEDVEAVHKIGCEFFGEGVTDPDKIRAILRRFNRGLMVAYATDECSRLVVRGYFFAFPIKQSCVNLIQQGRFSIANLDPREIATQYRYGHAVYIGAIAGTTRLVCGRLIGATQGCYQDVIKTKSRTAYAKAATSRGRELLERNDFSPVHPQAKGIGCFYEKTIPHSYQPEPLRKNAISRQKLRKKRRRGKQATGVGTGTP